jgi:hypothetical protein
MSILALTLVTLISSAADSDRVQRVTLVVERQTALQVGEVAVLRIPSEHHFSIGNAGYVLVAVRHSRRIVLYRAVRPGNETIILSPHVPTGECVSCATLHYFITVGPRT